MKLDSLENLFVHEIKDLLSAEKQLVKALPKMAKGASNPSLKSAIEAHLEQTKGHVERLEKVFELLGKTGRRALQSDGGADRGGRRSAGGGRR